MTPDKSCHLKGQQKLFYFQNGLASSCCRSHEISLDSDKTLDHYIDLWQLEKSQLQQGIEIQSCEHCWHNERRGLPSFRQQHTKGHDIELYFDNLCNHMCSYCSAKLSSVWEESIAQHGVFDNISKTALANQQVPVRTPTHIDHWLDEIHDHISQQNDNSVMVKICGGEPLMQMKNLQKFLKLDNSKIKKLSINTNLNPPSNRFLIWILENFPTHKLHFFVSLDATLGFNAVPRAGFDQDRFSANLSLLKQHEATFSFMSVISVLSVFDTDNFNQWIIDNHYQTVYNQLNNPDCLDPVYLPAKFKQKILDCGRNLPELVVKVLSVSVSNPGLVDLKLFEQYNYLKQYFSRSGTDPDKTGNQAFGEYWQWLQANHS